MEQSPYEAICHSVIQEIPRLLWNPEFMHHVHNSLPLDPVLSQMNLVHTRILG